MHSRTSLVLGCEALDYETEQRHRMRPRPEFKAACADAKRTMARLKGSMNAKNFDYSVDPAQRSYFTESATAYQDAMKAGFRPPPLDRAAKDALRTANFALGHDAPHLETSYRTTYKPRMSTEAPKRADGAEMRKVHFDMGQERIAPKSTTASAHGPLHKPEALRQAERQTIAETITALRRSNFVLGNERLDYQTTGALPDPGSCHAPASVALQLGQHHFQLGLDGTPRVSEYQSMAEHLPTPQVPPGSIPTLEELVERQRKSVRPSNKLAESGRSSVVLGTRADATRTATEAHERYCWPQVVHSSSAMEAAVRARTELVRTGSIQLGTDGPCTYETWGRLPAPALHQSTAPPSKADRRVAKRKTAQSHLVLGSDATSYVSCYAAEVGGSCKDPAAALAETGVGAAKVHGTLSSTIVLGTGAMSFESTARRAGLAVAAGGLSSSLRTELDAIRARKQALKAHSMEFGTDAGAAAVEERFKTSNAMPHHGEAERRAAKPPLVPLAQSALLLGMPDVQEYGTTYEHLCRARA